MESERVPIPEAAARLGINRDQAYRLAKRGDFPLPVHRAGRSPFVLRSDLDRLLTGADLAAGPTALAVVDPVHPALAHAELELRRAENAVAYWSLQCDVIARAVGESATRSA